MNACLKTIISILLLVPAMHSCSTDDVKMPEGPAAGSDDGMPAVVGVPLLTRPGRITFEPSPLFSWDAADGAAVYELLVANLSTGQAEVIAESEIAATEYTPVIGLEPGNYRATVRGVAEDGSYGGWSENHDFEVAVETGRNGAPTLTGPEAAPTTDRPTFTWDEYPNATTYELLVNNLTTGQSRAVYESHLGGTTFTPGVPLAAGAYRAWVRAYDASGGASGWSIGRAFTIGTQ